MPVRVLIADDHRVVRDGLHMYLSLDDDLEVLGEAANGAEALEMARQLKPDVVLMDLMMPVMDGIAATAAITRELPQTKVLAITSIPEDEKVVEVVRAGAAGYLLKDTGAQELREAIKAAAAGQPILSPAATAELVREVRAPASPRVSPEVVTPVRTFLIADVRGYTRFTLERGDEEAARLAARFATVAREGVEARGGQVVELRGDEVLAVFASPRQALRAAVDLQARFGQEMEADPSLPLKVGIGIDAGEAVPVEGGYRGAALNLAARLCSLAAAGEILVTEEVVHLARKLEGIAFVERGLVSLKGFTEPVGVVQVVREGEIPKQAATHDGVGAPPSVSRPDALTAPATPFIGRERQVEAVRARLLQPQVRLLTLTGPGGSGKTRLALQVANGLRDEFRDGTFVVSLASINDPALVAPTIAGALGVMEAGGQSLLESLRQYLRDLQALLVLDNFEQVLEAAPVVADLSVGAPGLKILVTSRRVLGVYGEYTFPVPPLSLPDPSHLPDLEALSSYEAVRLFVERAQAAKPDFRLTEENAAAVAEICHRLDGLPLAIELAAARVRLLPPQAILARLESMLKLLTGGARTLPARQQTLRSAIDWSYDLLDEGEQKLFARMAVFVDGCTLEAVEAVCNAGGDLDVLEGVSSLVDESLLGQEEGPGNEARFPMLHTIREYALERLAASGEEETLRRRHAEYFLDLAERAEPNLTGPLQAMWLDRLEAEHGNLRAVMSWSLGSAGNDSLDKFELGLRLGGALWRFWYLRNHLSEGRRWVNVALERDSVVAPSLRAQALSAAAWLAMLAGEHDRAMLLLIESLALRRELGDKHGIAASMDTLGLVLLEQGDYEQAKGYLEEGLALMREIDDARGIAASLHSLGMLALFQDEYDRAAELLEESLDMLRPFGDNSTIGNTLHSLGIVALYQGNYERAATLLEEAMSLFWKVGATWGVAECLLALAGVAGARGQARRSATLFGAAGKLRDALGVPLSPAEHSLYERYLYAARESLDETEFVTAWAEGEAMTPEQATEYALKELAGARDGASTAIP